jgi:hypothetical protein
MNRTKGKASPKTSTRAHAQKPQKKASSPGVKSTPRPVQRKERSIPAGPVSNTGFQSIGKNIGSSLGSIAGSVLGRISGMGAYRVRKNTITNGNPPVFGNGEITLSRREYICDISSAGAAFTLQSFDINPGLVATFPWLSQIAANYQQYEFLGLVFEYCQRSATAIASTNTALGSVIMATDYNTVDTNFTNKQAMEAYEFACSGCPDQNIVHPVECDPRMNTLSELYVRTGADPAATDERFYDLGNFEIATVGQQAVSVIGELWVSYHIRLFKPKIVNPLGALIPMLHATGTAAGANQGLANHVQNYNSIGSVLTTTTFTLPLVGNYLIAATWATANANLAAAPGLSLGANIAGVNLWNGDSVSNQANFTSGQADIMETVTVSTAGTAAANTITVTGLTSGTGCIFDLFVLPITVGITLKKSPLQVLQERLEHMEELLTRRVVLEIEEKESPKICLPSSRSGSIKKA